MHDRTIRSTNKKFNQLISLLLKIGGNMKKVLLLLLLVTQHINYGCNLCIGYTGKWFQKAAPQKVECNCNCYQQARSKHEDGYKCLQCGHRQLPWDIYKTTQSDLNLDTPFAEIMQLWDLNFDAINPWKEQRLQRYVHAKYSQLKQYVRRLEQPFAIILVDQL